VRPSPVLCTRSPTRATVHVAARHVAPDSCTPRDKQTRFSERTRGKEKQKQKQKHLGFEFKPCHVNDSSQSNQVTVHLVSHYLLVSSFCIVWVNLLELYASPLNFFFENNCKLSYFSPCVLQRTHAWLHARWLLIWLALL
jgi:hypothetical protein